MNARRILASSIAALSLLHAPSARATSAQWYGTTDSSWGTPTNWIPNGTPGTGDVATFGIPNNGHTTISLGGGVTIKQINFDTAPAYTIGANGVNGETLTFNDGGYVQVESNVTTGQLFNAAIVLGTAATAATYTFYNFGLGETLTIAGNITGGGAGGTNVKTLTFSGGTIIDSGVIGGGGGVIAVNANSTMTLSGTNTFKGALTIGGTLSVPVVNNVSTDGPLGNSAAATPVTFTDANHTATLEYTGATAISSKTFAISSSTTGAFQIDSAATNLTLSGLISGAGFFQKSGAGTLTVTNANSYTGGTTISAGTLVLSGSGTLGATTGGLTVLGTLDLGGTSQTVASLGSNFVAGGAILNNGGGASTLTINSTVSSAYYGTIADNNNSTSGTVALTKSGTGTEQLFGATSYSGATLVTAGSLDVFSNAGLGTAAAGTTVSSGATLYLGGVTIGGEAISIAGAGSSGNAGALVGDGGASDVTYGGLLTLTAASTIAGFDNFSITNPGTITGATFGLTLAGDTANGSIASVIGTTSGTLTKAGLGKWTLTGANTYTGLTTISAGILNIQNASALGGTTNGTTITSGATLQIQGGITVGAEALTIRGAGTSPATGALENVSDTNNYGGAITLGAASTIAVDAGTLNLTNTGNITGATFGLTLAGAGDGSIAGNIVTTTGALSKNGNGTWTLSGANTYTGGTTITTGTLKLAGSGTLGAATGTLTINNAATLDLNGTSQTVGGLSSSVSARILNNGGGASAITVNTTSSNIFYGTIIDHDNATAGTVALTKAGTGILTLFGVNSYSGATLVTGGVLVADTDTALGGTATGTTVNSGGTLALGSAATLISEPITIAGAGASGQSGALIGEGANYGGTLTLSAASTIGTDTSAFNITNPGTITGATFALTLNGIGSGEIDSIIGTTSGTLTKTGTGTWTLTGANTYTGLTTISAGVLNIQNASALGTTANGTSITSGATLQIQGVSIGAEPLTIRGAGASGATGALENVSGTNTYGGPITLGAASTISSDAGTLNLTSATITGATFGLTLAGAGDGSIASVIGTTTGGVSISSPATWTLTGANTFTGALKVTGGGTLVVPTVNNVSTAGPLGAATAATPVTLDGTLEYTGATATSTKPFTLSTGGNFQIDSAATELTLSAALAGTGATLGKSGPGTLTLTAANTRTGDVYVTGGTLKLSGAGALGAATGYVYVGATLDLGGTSQAVGTLDGTGTIVNNSGGGTSTLTIKSTGTGAVFTGTIADNNNATAGVVAVTINGTGVANIGGPNTYTGATLVSTGGLSILSDSALGSATGITTVSSGASLVFGAVFGTFATPLNVSAEPITISGVGASGETGALVSNVDGNTYGGLLKLGASATVSSDNGTFNLTNTGTITSAFTLTLGGAGDGVLVSVIGTSALTKSGTGTWTLTGANTYTGVTTISAGILNIQNASALGTTTNGTTISVAGATLQIQGGISVGAEALTIRGAGTSPATGAFENVSDTNSYGGAITLGAASTITSDAGTLNLTNNISGATFALTLAGAGDGSIAGAIGTTSGTLTKNGTGAWTLSGANTYTGATTINAGVLDIQNASALGGTTSGTTVASGATLLLDGNVTFAAEPLNISGTGASGKSGALELIANDTATYAGSLTLGANATVAVDNFATLNLTGASITGSGFALTLTGGGTGSIANVIGTGAAGVTKNSFGTWTLSGANTFSGTLTVQDGTLAVPTFNNASSNGPLGNSANAVVLGGSGTPTLEYTGSSATSSKPISFTSSGGTLQIDNAATELTLTGGVNGSGTFTRKGAGTLTLGGAGSFSSTTDVAAGTLKLTAAGALGSTFSIFVLTGATLQLAGTGDRINDNAILLLQGGTFSTAGLSNQTETMGNFRLQLLPSSIDFGSGSGDDLIFSGVGTHTAGIKLSILNWSGTPGALGGAANDRLIFDGVSSAFTTTYAQADVSFNGVNGYATIQYDASHYEVLAPEPSASALLAAAWLALAGFRQRRKIRRL